MHDAGPVSVAPALTGGAEPAAGGAVAPGPAARTATAPPPAPPPSWTWNMGSTRRTSMRYAAHDATAALLYACHAQRLQVHMQIVRSAARWPMLCSMSLIQVSQQRVLHVCQQQLLLHSCCQPVLLHEDMQLLMQYTLIAGSHGLVTCLLSCFFWFASSSFC